jgi:hypothetical protein
VSRRPRRNRPPRLPDPEPLARTRADRPPQTPRGRLVTAHVTGPHASLGRSEVAHVLGRLAAGAPDARLGLPLDRVTRDEAWGVLGRGWGWDGSTPRAAIDPDRTIAGIEHARHRLRAVGAAGGRVAVATGHPASLLTLLTAMADLAAASGAAVLTCDHSVALRAGNRALWWLGPVAVVTDGESLLGDDGGDAADEWLFRAGRPDLVVADGAFAGAAAAAGHETIALADLDVPALGLAGEQGLPVALLPLDTSRPPAAYLPLVELLTGGAPEPGQPGEQPAPPDPATRHQPPHSTTPTPGA